MNNCFQNNHSHKRICVICKRTYVGKDYDATPIKRGKCCKECYIKNILPTNIALRR